MKKTLEEKQTGFVKKLSTVRYKKSNTACALLTIAGGLTFLSGVITAESNAFSASICVIAGAALIAGGLESKYAIIRKKYYTNQIDRIDKKLRKINKKQKKSLEVQTPKTEEKEKTL